MVESQKIPVKDLFYTRNDIGYVFLERLLDRMVPISALTGSAPLEKVIGSLANLPIELLLMVLENLAITHVMRFRRCNRFAMLESYRCGKPAQNIYLPTCMRLCFMCVRCLSGTKPLVNYATAYRTLGPEDIAKIPSFRPLEVTLVYDLSEVRIEGLKRVYGGRYMRKLVRDRQKPVISAEERLENRPGLFDTLRSHGVDVVAAVPMWYLSPMSTVIVPLIDPVLSQAEQD
jgi:hypothetical protein